MKKRIHLALASMSDCPFQVLTSKLDHKTLSEMIAWLLEVPTARKFPSQKAFWLLSGLNSKQGW
jgi:hypothetical protein